MNRAFYIIAIPAFITSFCWLTFGWGWRFAAMVTRGGIDRGRGGGDIFDAAAERAERWPSRRPLTAENRAMVITEIFKSIQGEGTRAGLPCIFVRLTGCNLRCTWCDTAYAFYGGTKSSIDEIVEKVRTLAGGGAHCVAWWKLPAANLSCSPRLQNCQAARREWLHNDD